MNLPARLVLCRLLFSTPTWATNPAEAEFTPKRVLEQEGALYLD